MRNKEQNICQGTIHQMTKPKTTQLNNNLETKI